MQLYEYCNPAAVLMVGSAVTIDWKNWKLKFENFNKQKFCVVMMCEWYLIYGFN